MLIEWDSTEGAAQVPHNFPLAFSKLFCMTLASLHQGYDYTPVAVNRTNTGFSWGNWGNPYTYIALGS